MRGKIAFVLGAAVGYVLGTRAGRERYQQIKNGAEALWNTAPVQQGVSVVQGAVGDGLNTLKEAAAQSGKDLFVSLAKNMQTSDEQSSGSKRAASSSTSAGNSAKRATGTKKSSDESGGDAA